MDDRKYLRKKRLLKKSLYPKRSRKSRQLYSIGDMVRCRVRSTVRRGSDLIIGVVVDRRKVFGTMSDYTYSVATSRGLFRTPRVRIVKAA